MSTTALILIASEQVWPNLQSVVWYHKRGGLRRVFVYHTTDEVRSAGPARRIQAFCRQLYPQEPELCQLPAAGLTMDPAEAAAQLRAWQQAHPQISRWVINATGGTKLLFCGALNALQTTTTDVSWEMIYREVTGGWYAVTRNAEGRFTAHRQPPEFVPPSILNEVPVLSLIATQYPGEGLDWSAADPSDFTAITAQHLEAMLAGGRAANWNWQQLFTAQGLPYSRPGAAFERVTAAAVHLLGVPASQIALNAMARDRESSNPRHEIDIVVNLDGRLLLIDCKLLDARREGDTFITHMTATHDLARALGGSAAEGIMARPNLIVRPELHELARAWRMKVLDQTACQRFFSALGEVLRRPTRPDMLQWENNYLPMISDEYLLPVAKGENDALRGRLLSLQAPYERIRRQAAEGSRRPWLACRVEGGLWLLGDHRPVSLPQKAVRALLRRTLNGWGQVVGLHVSANGTRWTALVMVGNNEKPLRDWLTSRRDRPLLE